MPESELSSQSFANEKEYSLLKGLLSDRQFWTNLNDFQYLLPNEQINAEQEAIIRAKNRLLVEQEKLKGPFKLGYIFNLSAINQLNDNQLLLGQRILELKSEWIGLDQQEREISGVRLEDLDNLLNRIGYPQFSKFKKGRGDAYHQYYCNEPEKREILLFGNRIIPCPRYDNFEEQPLDDTDPFLEITAKLGISDKIICQPQSPSEYFRLVVPFEGWVFIRPDVPAGYFAGQHNFPKDPNYNPEILPFLIYPDS